MSPTNRPSGQPLPQGRIADIRRLRLQGKSIREIVELTGVSQSSVEKYCKEADAGSMATAKDIEAMYGEISQD